jgi:hypothetical protein
MLTEQPFKALGLTPIDPFLDYFKTHELPWKSVDNPYSKRETLPVTWCHRNLVDGKIKLFQIDQAKELIQLTNSALQSLQSYVPGTPIRVFYAKLMPGDSILPHIDKGCTFRASHRCHLPIKAPEGIEFQCANETYIPQEGVWFELNNCLQHSVSNIASSERLHLIVDVLQKGQEHLLD